LDISKVVKSPTEAISLAKQHHQLSYYDFGQRRQIDEPEW